MTTHKTADLEGALLDAAVARAEGRGLLFDFRGEPAQCFVDGVLYSPSTDWSLGGPIVQRERIELLRSGPGWCAQVGSSKGAVEDGHTPLIAAMRAYVASRFGETVELP
jgi:hypothetical protein